MSLNLIKHEEFVESLKKTLNDDINSKVELELEYNTLYAIHINFKNRFKRFGTKFN